jgi:diguanylate cyclase (GGDEF)-like protein
MKQSTAVLRRRLVVSLVAAGLLPFAGAAWIAHTVSVEDQRRAATEHLEAQVLGATGAIQAAVEQARDQATALARDRRVQTALVLNDTYTLGAMSAAGATIARGAPRPVASPAVQVSVRADGRAIGHVTVRLPEPAVILDRVRLAAGPEAAVSLVRDGKLLARSGPEAGESPAASTMRERPVPELGRGYRLVVVDTAEPPSATGVGGRLGIAAALSIAAIAVLALSLATPLLKGLTVVEQAAAEAEVDPLTGLANRRAFNRTLEHELARSQRTGRPCSLVLVDLDDFKLLNDRHGHAVGDEALKLVADVLRAGIRTIDLAARLGGEELAVLLPETAADQAVVVAERLRVTLERAQLVGTDGGTVGVTGSLGVADTEVAPGMEALVKAADEALYAAKRAGKNQVVVAGAAAANAA